MTMIDKTGRHAGLLQTGSTLLLTLSLFNPCFAGKPKTAVGVNIDFSSYKTYRWLPTRILTKAGVVEDDPTIVPAVRNAVNRELTARGLTEVAEGGDLQVSTFVLTTSVPQLEAVIFAGGVPLDFATPIASMGRYNREGTLAINLIDTKTKKYAWAGMITESVDNKPGAGVKKIGPAAEKLFSKFPLKK
jgi:Domain of unknown function (DUF4136)